MTRQSINTATLQSNQTEMVKDLLEAKQQVEQGITFTMQEAKDRIEKHLSKWK